MEILSPTQARYPKAAQAARDFEAAQLGALFQTMVDQLKGDGPLGEGPAGGVFRSLLVDEIANATAANGGIGMAAPVYRQLLALDGLSDANGIR